MRKPPENPTGRKRGTVNAALTRRVGDLARDNCPPRSRQVAKVEVASWNGVVYLESAKQRSEARAREVGTNWHEKDKSRELKSLACRTHQGFEHKLKQFICVGWANKWQRQISGSILNFTPESQKDVAGVRSKTTKKHEDLRASTSIKRPSTSRNGKIKIGFKPQSCVVAYLLSNLHLYLQMTLQGPRRGRWVLKYMERHGNLQSNTAMLFLH